MHGFALSASFRCGHNFGRLRMIMDQRHTDSVVVSRAGRALSVRGLLRVTPRTSPSKDNNISPHLPTRLTDFPTSPDLAINQQRHPFNPLLLTQRRYYRITIKW
ncbi:unnamed protein product [Leptosia nina]|uniref:Uncharacterized protein n=1 Tax=Leptosia nina TaxID=320188 RepID=A0AAV1JKS8_9NEOP